MGAEQVDSPFRQIPSVDRCLEMAAHLRVRVPHDVLAAEIRLLQERWRTEIRESGSLPAEDFVRALEDAITALETASLRHVINATGVVLHTNLGRAPLGRKQFLEGYSNLEFNLEEGVRGKRDVHTQGLLERLLGQASVVVNNNAAATYLVLRALAAGKEVIVSRGELIEIGDGFRIPDIMAEAGVVLREVGTTNRTHLGDYESAINENTALIVRVHASNFRIEGFTARPDLEALTGMAHARGVPVYDDLGSGNLVDLRAAGIDEPIAGDSFAAGADLVSFSGDKLLGGPQAGIIAGRPDLVNRIRRHPMYRSFRVDKLILEALESTLRALYFRRYDEIPALRMILESPDAVANRAAAFARSLERMPVTLAEGESRIGGGSTPQQSLPTTLLAIDVPGVETASARLRLGDPAILCRIEQEKLIFDLRTVLPDEEGTLRQALLALFEGSRAPARIDADGAPNGA